MYRETIEIKCLFRTLAILMIDAEVKIIKQVCEDLKDVYQDIDCLIRFDVKYWKGKVGKMGLLPQVQIDEWIKEHDLYIGLLRSWFGTPTNGINPDTDFNPICLPA